MALAGALIERVAALAQAAGPEAEAVLRAALPPGALSVCDAADVDFAAPAAALTHYDLHLLDGRSHCRELTQDPDLATGFVLARKRAGGRP
jgi:hypothetical protein